VAYGLGGFDGGGLGGHLPRDLGLLLYDRRHVDGAFRSVRIQTTEHLLLLRLTLSGKGVPGGAKSALFDS
jgi:hypothetical protein